jgi:hypothetical protein
VSVRYFRCLVCFKHYHRSEWRLLGQEILSEDLIAVGRVFAKDAAKYIGVVELLDMPSWVRHLLPCLFQHCCP